MSRLVPAAFMARWAPGTTRRRSVLDVGVVVEAVVEVDGAADRDLTLGVKGRSCGGVWQVEGWVWCGVVGDEGKYACGGVGRGREDVEEVEEVAAAEGEVPARR